MAKEFRAEQVINGTFGEMWIDGEYLANVTALKAEVTLKKTPISMVQRLMEGQKINSFFIKKMNECFRRGKMMTCTIISNVKDPDALGGERIALYNCLFDKMTLADWEAGKMGEESYSFTFEDWEILDKI